MGYSLYKMRFLPSIFLLETILLALVFCRQPDQIHHCAEDCKCENQYDTTITTVYVGCVRKGYHQLPESIPSNTTCLNFPSNYLVNISDTTFQFLTELEIVILNDNKIEVISENAFRMLKHLKQLLLKRNKIKHFPWRSLLYLNLEVLLLEHNAIKTLPSENLVLDGLANVSLFSIFPNPILCSCDLISFGKWMNTLKSQPQKVTIDQRESLKCKSNLGWISKNVADVGNHKSVCKKPSIQIVVSNGTNTLVPASVKHYQLKNEISGLESAGEKEIAIISVDKTSNLTLTCDRLSGSASSTILKTALVYNEENSISYDTLNWSIQTNRSFINVNQTSSGMRFVCIAENFAGTSVAQAYINITSAVTDKSLSQRVATATTTKGTTTYKPLNLCGTMGEMNVTLLKPVSSEPTTYEKVFAPYGMTVQMKQERKHNAIIVHVTGSSHHNDMFRVCHTHGAQMLYRDVHLSPPKDLLTLNVLSLSTDYLVCVEIPVVRGQMCGNFTVVPTPRDNMMVMFIVGGFLLSIAVIPLVLALCHAWREVTSARNSPYSFSKRCRLLDHPGKANKQIQKKKIFCKNLRQQTRSMNEENQLIETTCYKLESSKVPEKEKRAAAKTLSCVTETLPTISSRVITTETDEQNVENKNNQTTVEQWLNNMQPEEWSQFSREESDSIDEY